MSKEIRISFKNFPIYFLILVTTSSLVNSQQEASFSMYMFNHQLINPAYVGAQDYTQITMTNRSQWQQFQGAPITQSFNIGHRFRSKIALGASVVHDKIGPLKNTSASLDFAYHLNLNNKNLIYVDNNATTKVDPKVLDAILPYFSELYGNPSSMHSFGGSNGQKIRQARENLAALINASPEEIVFTSCGTESDNTAIMAAVNSFPEKKHIITTRVEHPAVKNMLSMINLYWPQS